MKGEKRILPTIRVAPPSRFRDAVVAIRDIEDKAFMNGFKGHDYVSAFCEWMTYTGVVVKQKTFHVENHDADPEHPKSAKGVLHNPHAFEVLGPSSTTVFNIGLAELGAKLDKPVVLRKDKQGLMFRLQCDQHEFMQAFLPSCFESPLRCSQGGRTFEIKDVPAGKHRLLAWHRLAGRVEIDVDVPEGAAVQTKLEVTK
ncbi:hypothetical protein [Nitrospira sp. Nam74]